MANPDQNPGRGEVSDGRDGSIEQRREALRRIGRSAAAAGAASPLSALAGGSAGPRKWCQDKYKTKKVHASISGCNSVVLSAQSGNECYGKPCSYYGSSTHIPVSCKSGATAKKFKDIFTCVSGSKDSKNVTYNPNNAGNGCLYHKKIDDLCTSNASSPEAHWATAYCNSAALWTSDTTTKFPYSTTQVNSHWTDSSTRLAAYSFYTTYMEGG